ncbi:hypothetical protein [Cellvibrio japonicus]|uniref:Uncharacterized protein n=1 Tax=Cellvibrio japonicus (strain Ueda107) TaxID=498211 RepID=B3PGQ6_CELJU|nr:hypothetical protein [Cellvibrio japonicus]ACE84628.1 conserved hypothetical protein [Cellvibrio japonicus Ueda107]QEI12401.1 hypothetical protein FY117_09295 [Cellvibrio japonicus]QEI15974.1 hypothetical protein FY116_09300 [Cellvibrio japonicus]QEI19553.1 hypothetical protein FY115_09295 [Cellvibrio japonicus]
MDQESIVYGCIKDTASTLAISEHIRANREAMLSLPHADEWPFISQEMFAIPQLDSPNSNYQTEVMHFGASYKAVEYEWDQWIAQFEALLSKMYWVSATVHLETELSGTHTFTWETKSSYHRPGSGDMRVRCEWSHEGGLHL